MDDIQELENTILETHRRLQALLQQKKEMQENYQPEIVCDDNFEQFIEQDPQNFVLKSMDNENTPLTIYIRANIKTLKPVIRFFQGKTDGDKKMKLIQLLKKVPGLKTNNIKLLEQRLYVFNRGVRNLGYQGPLEEFPDTVNAGQ